VIEIIFFYGIILPVKFIKRAAGAKPAALDDN
jgi:hypothetical protein